MLFIFGYFLCMYFHTDCKEHPLELFGHREFNWLFWLIAKSSEVT